MTSGARSSSARAAATVVENSRSVISTLASQWRRMNAMVRASRRVLMVFSTAPSIGTPKLAS